MSAALLIAAVQGQMNRLSGKPYDDQIQPVVQEIISKSGVPARRVQELHWFSADEDYWFTALALRLGLAADMPHFHWPAVPLLTHSSLQSIARSIEAGERELVLLGQQSGEQVIALLLASPAAVGRFNLAARAQLAARFAISRRPDGFLQSAARAVAQAGRDPAEIGFIASTIAMPANELKAAFRGAKLLPAELRVVSSDLFLLDGLVRALEETHVGHGLLLSAGPHGSGIATWVERT